MNITNSLQSIIRKNFSEIKQLLLGTYPSCFYGVPSGKPIHDIPVFVFHEVNAEDLEQRFAFLKDNGYETLSIHEWYRHLQEKIPFSDHQVLLTFDDCHITLFTAAYPLLRKYGFHAVSFLCPGIIPDADVSNGRGRTMCHWDEIRTMYTSGLVNFQSHGMYHDLVFSSDTPIDFLSPDFRSYYMGKNDKAVLLRKNGLTSMTILWPFNNDAAYDAFAGHPIFTVRPKLASDKRFNENITFVDRVCDHVKQKGGVKYLTSRNRNKELWNELRSSGRVDRGVYLSFDKVDQELRYDYQGSKRIIEEKIPGEKVEHFCYPWFETTAHSLDIAYGCGYKTAFLGDDITRWGKKDGDGNAILPVRRFADYYIYCLPGKGRRSIVSLIADKVFRIHRKEGMVS